MASRMGRRRRLTRLAKSAIDAIELERGFTPSCRVMVLIHDDAATAVAVHGYPQTRHGHAQIVAELLLHAEAIAAAAGLELELRERPVPDERNGDPNG